MTVESHLRFQNKKARRCEKDLVKFSPKGKESKGFPRSPEDFPEEIVARKVRTGLQESLDNGGMNGGEWTASAPCN